MTQWPPPEIPQWAREDGCPSPKEGESFRSYVERLGLDFDDLTIELDQQTADLANLRLAYALRSRNPESFARHIRKKAQAERERYSYSQ
jgi:hypothetical protein